MHCPPGVQLQGAVNAHELSLLIRAADLPIRAHRTVHRPPSARAGDKNTPSRPPAFRPLATLTPNQYDLGREAVVAYDGDRPAGFAYCSPLGPATRWWSTMTTPLPEGYTDEDGTRTLALNEIAVRRDWRGTGLARRIHEELLSDRQEKRVMLLVNPAPSDGKVQKLSEQWGYEPVGTQQPFPDSPVMTAMTRSLRS
ncbi:GNAT family N-acetyltransferase [Streptomyces alboflavus]|uniref:GNAT family N-acetyltransferase n=1 Tax=Streptomyces alboflavus TaxID=67267 RepID=UPI001F26E6EA|nr:GNAT family N-acetyltransferase [Streptomyces alboflavus]